MASAPHRPSNEEPELDMEELVMIEESPSLSSSYCSSSSSSAGGSPTRYSARTIRQKKGRQLITTLNKTHNNNTKIDSEDSEPSPVPEEKTTSTITNTTTTRTCRTLTTDMFDPESTVSLTGEGKGFGNNKGGQPFLSSVGLYQGLSRVQAYSAMAFGAFTFIHMVPPVLASVGGIDLADKALMWGRVYYQAPGIEQILVLNALGIHIVSGLSKALIRLVWKAKRAYHVYISKSPVDAQDAQDAVNDLTYSSSSSSETVVVTATSTRTSTSAAASTGSSSDTTVNSGSGSAPGLFPYHRLVGWILTPIVFDHLNTMRIVPLNILGDSSMIDFSFISYLYRSGQQHPFVYVLLVALSSYHMISGGLAAYNLVLPRGSERRIKVRDMIQSKKSRLAAVSMLAVVALVGVYRIMTVEGVIPMSKVYARLMLSV